MESVSSVCSGEVPVEDGDVCPLFSGYLGGLFERASASDGVVVDVGWLRLVNCSASRFNAS